MSYPDSGSFVDGVRFFLFKMWLTIKTKTPQVPGNNQLDIPGRIWYPCSNPAIMR